MYENIIVCSKLDSSIRGKRSRDFPRTEAYLLSCDSRRIGSLKYAEPSRDPLSLLLRSITGPLHNGLPGTRLMENRNKPRRRTFDRVEIRLALDWDV